jgi:hypothetical protein
MDLQNISTISTINNHTVATATDSQQQPTQQYIEANSNNFSEPSTANNSRAIYATTTNENSQNTNNAKLLPIFGSEEPFPNSPGWTCELFVSDLRHKNIKYNQSVFNYDFYQACFAPYFRLADVCIDWLQDAFNPDEKYVTNKGFVAIYNFITSEELQDYYNGYFTCKASNLGYGFVGYVKNLLQKNPISNDNLRKLEVEFEKLGRGLEVDFDENFDKLSEERKEFYCSHTPTKKHILASNIFKHFKNNPHILQNNPRLNEVVTAYGVNANGDDFYSFLCAIIDGYCKNYKKYENSCMYRESFLERECLSLNFYIDQILSCLLPLYRDPMYFYSVAKKVNNTDASD